MEKLVFTIISLTILSPGWSQTKLDVFKKVNKEMRDEEGIIRDVEVDSRTRCAFACLQTGNCTSFQIDKSISPGKKATCLILDTNVQEEKSVSSQFDFYEFCPDTCFNGGVKDDAGCACECPSSPRIFRGTSCEKVYEWKYFKGWNVDDKYTIRTMWNGQSPVEVCKHECEKNKGCWSTTAHVKPMDCELTSADLSVPNFNDYALTEAYDTYALVPVSGT